MSTETREEAIERWEGQGLLVKDCPGCKEYYEFNGKPADLMAPRHSPSIQCQSGKRPHCTCDACF